MESDEQIIQKVLSGDREAYGELVSRHQDPLFAMALARLRDPVAAREAALDALTQGYVSLGQLREPSRFPSWIRSILHRSCLKELRDRALKVALDAGVPDPQASPDQSLQERSMAGRLSQSLNALPATYREPVVLHYFMDFSIAEIAGLLGVPGGTVKRRLHEARRVMKGVMADHPLSLKVQLEEEINMRIARKDLSGSSIEYANMIEASLTNVDFTGSTFEHVNISGVTFRNAGGGDGTPARDLTFEHCTMQNSRFRRVDLSDCQFEGVSFRGAQLRSCDLEGMTIDGQDVSALLRNALPSE